MLPHRLFPWRLLARFLLAAALLAGAGCGGSTSNNCKLTALNVTPSSMTVNHAAAPPANSQSFTSSGLLTGNGVCTGEHGSNDQLELDGERSLCPSFGFTNHAGYGYLHRYAHQPGNH